MRRPLPRGRPVPGGEPRGLSPVLKLPGGRPQEDLFDEHVGEDRAGVPSAEPGRRCVPYNGILGQAGDLLSDEVLRGLGARPELYQKSKGLGSL
jgi:hypothetical protein